MMKRVGLAMILGFLVMVPDALGNTTRGISELMLSGSLSTMMGNDVGPRDFYLTAGHGTFVHSSIEVGSLVSFMLNDSNEISGTASALILFYPQSWTIKNIHSYAGLQIGIGLGSGDNPLIYGGRAGSKYFLSERGTVFIEPYYVRYEYDIGAQNEFGISTGISVLY